MAIYKYNAFNQQTSETVSGKIEAESVKEVRLILKGQGLLPTKIVNTEDENMAANREMARRKLEHENLYIRKLSLNDKYYLTAELRLLLGSQVPMINALEMISCRIAKRALGRLLRGLIIQLKEGLSLKESMETYRGVFDSVFIGLVAAGEESGHYGEVFERLNIMYKKALEVRKRLIKESIYPCILIVIAICAFFVVGGVILPRLFSVSMTQGNDFPWYMVLFMGVCAFVKKFGLFVIIGLIACFYALSQVVNGTALKKIRDTVLIYVPLVGNFVKIKNLSNYIEVLGIAYDAGIPIIQSTKLATETINNGLLYNKAKMVTNYLERGRTLVQAFDLVRLLDADYVNMVQAGEVTGEIGSMLKQVAEILDRRLDTAIEALTQSFYPLSLVLCAIICAPILFVLVPIVVTGGAFVI